MVFITAVHMAGGVKHEHIADVKWKDPADGKTGESTRQAVVEFINGGGQANVTGGLNTAPVHVYEIHYLRTRPDGKWSDNLLALPRY